MVTSRKRSNLIPSSPLYLNGSQLDQVKSYKSLGVTITSNLSWLPHITSLCNKTRRLVGMVYRKFYQHSDSRTLLKLYLSIIRPHIEYASPVWDPYHKTEIEAIESVQKFALKKCLKSWNSNDEQLLLEARLPTLKARRSALSLGHLYKIINKLTLSRTSNNSKKYPSGTGVLMLTLSAYHMQLLLHINSPIQKLCRYLKEWQAVLALLVLSATWNNQTCKLTSIILLHVFKSHLFLCRYAFKVAI